jgi:hypothetical protein
MHSTISLVNAAATYGHFVVVVAAFVLVVMVTKLSAAAQDTTLERNKRRGESWPL